MEIVEFEEKVSLFIDKECKIGHFAPIIAAVSGGADSVAMLTVLHKLRYECVVAHCNFHLRGAESDRDEQFVRQLAAELGLKVEVEHFDVKSYMVQHKVSTEMACRELRYAWFDKLKQEYSAQAVAVAHHSDDAMETFFLNAARGSGVQGLAAIKPRNADVVRPLLDVTRYDIEEYLKQSGRTFVTDSTNMTNDYKRNKVRNVLIPTMWVLLPESQSGLLRTLRDMRSSARLYAEFVEGKKREICQSRGGGVVEVRYEPLLAMREAETMLFEILKDYGFNSWQAIEVWNALCHSGKRFYSRLYELSVERECLIISPGEAVADDEIVVDLRDANTFDGIMDVVRVNKKFTPGVVDGAMSIALSEDVMLAKDVILRHWRKGDRMRPFGMKGTKLLSDLFVDMKMSESEKRSAWVLEVDGTIVWVLGRRAADAYRIAKTAHGYVIINYIQQSE